jgi:hypothetical protein
MSRFYTNKPSIQGTYNYNCMKHRPILLKAEDQHQAHMLILHQQEEGGATILIVIIKLKGMINLTSNAIIAINLGILHQNVGENNMT